MAHKIGTIALDVDLHNKTDVVLPQIPLPTNGSVTVQLDYTALADNNMQLVLEQRISNRWATVESIPLEQAHTTHVLNIVNLKTRQARLRVSNPNGVGGTLEGIYFLI